MNRQSVAVVIGVVAFVAIALVLLFTTPNPEPNPPAGAQRAALGVGKAGKARSKAKSKAGDGRLLPRQLIHRRPIPEDLGPAPEGAPNVVVVFASTQRKDQWSVYGGPSQTTPYLAAQVAAHGVAMEDALAVAVSPHESAVALTTGRFPHALDAIESSPRRNGRPVPRRANTLAERFASKGWFAMGVSANHHFNRRMGQFQGFHWYRDSQPFSLMLERRIPAGQVVRFALRRVADRTEAEKARPLYLQLALVDSHKPFKVPPEEAKPFQDDSHAVAPYRATLRRLDNAVQTLAQGLAEQGLTVDNTLFVVVADHGEGLAMPEHHRREHGYMLYPSSVQVPWVMWGGGLPAGRRVPGLASVIDVAPTVASLAGLEVPAEQVDGIDHSKAVRGASSATIRTEAYAATLFRGAHRASLWTASRQCQKDFGSVHDLPDEVWTDGCFDRKGDPEFHTPVADDALTKRLVQQHEALMAKVGDGTDGE